MKYKVNTINPRTNKETPFTGTFSNKTAVMFWLDTFGKVFKRRGKELVLRESTKSV